MTCKKSPERVTGGKAFLALAALYAEISTREQQRIGFELHDGLGSTLGAIALKAELLREALHQEKSPHAPEALALVRLLKEAMIDTHRLARGLAPMDLELSGLPFALNALTQETQTHAGIQCLFSCHPPDLEMDVVAALPLFRIVQEAIHNALQHGQPRQIQVTLNLEGAQLCLAIRDDGKGFVPGNTTQQGLGLSLMRYRAEALGAELTVRSRPRQGTEVRCLLPDITRWQLARHKKSPS